MRFYIRKRRQPPAIIIVALIDILIVLLIFLTVTTTFKQQPAIRLALPQSSQAQKAGANENPPLIVSIDARGNYLLGTEARPVRDDQLKTELSAALAQKPDLSLAINADSNAPLGRFIRVWDAAKEANFREVRALTRQTK